MKMLTLIETHEELLEMAGPGKPLHGQVDLTRSDGKLALTQEALDQGYRLVPLSWEQCAIVLMQRWFIPPPVGSAPKEAPR